MGGTVRQANAPEPRIDARRGSSAVDDGRCNAAFVLDVVAGRKV